VADDGDPGQPLVRVEIVRHIELWQGPYCPVNYGIDEPGRQYDPAVAQVWVFDWIGNPVTNLVPSDFTITLDKQPPDGQLATAGFQPTETAGLYRAEFAFTESVSPNNVTLTVTVGGLSSTAIMEYHNPMFDAVCDPDVRVIAAPEPAILPATSSLIVHQEYGWTYGGSETAARFTIEAPPGITITPDPASVHTTEAGEYCSSVRTVYSWFTSVSDVESTCEYIISASAPGTYDITVTPTGGWVPPTTVQVTFLDPAVVGNATLEFSSPVVHLFEKDCAWATLATTTRLAEAELTLADASGQPITGLTASDFTIAYTSRLPIWRTDEPTTSGFTETATPGVYSATFNGGDVIESIFNVTVTARGLTATAVLYVNLAIERLVGDCPVTVALETEPEPVVWPAAATFTVSQRRDGDLTPVTTIPNFDVEAPAGVSVSFQPGTNYDYYDVLLQCGGAGNWQDSTYGPSCTVVITADAPGTYDITIVPWDPDSPAFTVQAVFTSDTGSGNTLAQVLNRLFDRLRALLANLAGTLR
jgi:hypothetical protein